MFAAGFTDLLLVSLVEMLLVSLVEMLLLFFFTVVAMELLMEYFHSPST
jgi:hypothetical protein